MPHYRNGTLAKVGDLVYGETYNRKGPRVGVVLKVEPAETCNCVVAFVTLEKLPPLPPEAAPWHSYLAAGHSTFIHDGVVTVLKADFDYGETRAFDLVSRADGSRVPDPAQVARPTNAERTSVRRLRRAVEETERDHPLPRCIHGACLMDGGGEMLEPPCGCRLYDDPAKPDEE